jgi:catechol 2,3-dioxygenase-like lactoylglutathione lyase family enzyme
MSGHVDDHELDSLHHVAISVRDIGEAVRWYTRTFRCKVVYEDETWAMLQFANVQLALVIPVQHPPHLGFVTPEAEKHGELRTHRDGTRSIYIADPAGNPVELLAPESLATSSA